MTRNRSTCGVKPYIRATCNPDPDSWVADFIDWFIMENGFPDPGKVGKLRYFVRDGDNFIWGNSEKEVIDAAWFMLQPLVEKSGFDPRVFVKSMTFIGGSIYDNKKLLEIDPGYLANLAAQDEETKLQLLLGNWKVSVNPKDIYNYNAYRSFYYNDWVASGRKCITVDVALQGKDKLVMMY